MRDVVEPCEIGAPTVRRLLAAAPGPIEEGSSGRRGRDVTGEAVPVVVRLELASNPLSRLEIGRAHV